MALGERLLLREWTPKDAPALSEAVQRNIEHLRPWMLWVAQEPVRANERVALINEWQQARPAGGDARFGAFLDGAVVGGCGLHRRSGSGGLEIGYWVDHEHTGLGLATEAAATLTTTGLSLPGVTFVEIHHDKANIASRRIPEHLGYQFIRETPDQVVAPGEIGIDCAWRMDVSAWRER
jgi:ribosomal-protein-serine acetyltransferase